MNKGDHVYYLLSLMKQLNVCPRLVIVERKASRLEGGWSWYMVLLLHLLLQVIFTSVHPQNIAEDLVI